MLKKFVLLIALTSAADAQHATPPELNDARITIPYSELKELWKAAQQNTLAPSKPPVSAALLSARYNVELGDDHLVGVVEFETQSFTDEWTMLRLVPATLQVDKIEPAGANLVAIEGALSLLTNHAAKQQVKLHFTAPLVQEGDDARAQLPSSAAVANLLTVRGVPADKTLHVGNAAAVSSAKDVAVFRLAAQEPIELRIAAISKTPNAPTQWQTAAQCFVRFSDDVLHYAAHVTAIANGGSAQSLRLKLPAGARVIAVESEDLASWRSDDSLIVTVQWRSANVPQRQVDVSYDLPQAAEGEWTLHAPEAGEGTTLPPIFAVATDAAFGLTASNESSSRPPRWLAEKTASIPNLLVTRSETVTARLLPVVEVAPAVVEEASFSTRIVSDGSLIAEQSYDIRTRGALVWSVELPQHSELLSCAIDDHRTNPIDRGNGTLELPIAPRAEGKPTRITLAYTSRIAAFQPVAGRLKVELPKTPLLINSLEWDVAIPAEYEVAALEGNVAPAPGARAREGSTVVHLKKELCRNERPAVELFYQRPEVSK